MYRDLTLEEAILLHSIGASVEYKHRWTDPPRRGSCDWAQCWMSVGGEPTRDWGWATQRGIEVKFRVTEEE